MDGIFEKDTKGIAAASAEIPVALSSTLTSDYADK